MSEELTGFLVSFLAVGGGATAIAFFVFQYLGKSVLNSWFDRQKEDYRQEQAAEFQRNKIELDALLSGALKLQALEHRVLPEAWQLLIDTRLHVRELTKPMFDDQDLDSMSSTQLEEFFGDIPLSESQKEKIRSSAEKLRTYAQELSPMYVRESERACIALQEVLLKNKIFLPSEIVDGFDQILLKLWSIVDEHESSRGSMEMDRRIELWNEQVKISKEIEELGSVLHDRFSQHGAIKR